MGGHRARGGVRAPAALLVLTKDADEPDEHAIEATLTADGDHTILVIEERVSPWTSSLRTAPGSRSTSKISPPTSPVESAATCRTVGRAPAQLQELAANVG